jgi:hypothetical protein
MINARADMQMTDRPTDRTGQQVSSDAHDVDKGCHSMGTRAKTNYFEKFEGGTR